MNVYSYVTFSEVDMGSGLESRGGHLWSPEVRKYFKQLILQQNQQYFALFIKIYIKTKGVFLYKISQGRQWQGSQVYKRSFEFTGGQKLLALGSRLKFLLHGGSPSGAAIFYSFIFNPTKIFTIKDLFGINGLAKPVTWSCFQGDMMRSNYGGKIH